MFRNIIRNASSAISSMSFWTLNAKTVYDIGQSEIQCKKVNHPDPAAKEYETTVQQASMPFGGTFYYPVRAEVEKQSTNSQSSTAIPKVGK